MSGPKPDNCPFCGGDKQMVLPPNCTKTGDYKPGDNAQPIVRCMTCYAEAIGDPWDDTKESAIIAWNRRAALSAKKRDDDHFDDVAVRTFAKMMAAKMAASRAKGRSGWDDPAQCSVNYLRQLLYVHLDKGDPVDVANICMMLRHYEARTAHEYESSAMAVACATRDEVIARLVEAAEKTLMATELREAYHRLPNDKNRIGDPKSPKAKARDAWLKAFRRASTATATALAAAKEVMK